MAKAQTIKPKSSFADWFKRLGAPKPKPAARPGGGAQSSSTMTNLRAAEAPASTCTRKNASVMSASRCNRSDQSSGSPYISALVVRWSFDGPPSTR